MVFIQGLALAHVRLNTALPLRMVTANSNNTLTIQEAGDYVVSYNLLMNASKPVTISAAVRNAGVVIPTTRGSHTLALDSTLNISYDARLSCTTIVSLAANSVLDVVTSVVNTLPENLDAVINGYANATLAVWKLN